MGNKKKDKKQEEKIVEPELKIIREIEPEIQEIKEDEMEEQEEREDFSEDFSLAETSTSGESGEAEAPVLKKRRLEQSVDEETPARKKEEKEKEDAGAKYAEMESDYMIKTDEGERREREEGERRRGMEEARMFKIERAPIAEKAGVIEKKIFKERPIQFIDESARGHVEEVMKYEKVDVTRARSDLPFAKKETEIERRVKKYKK